MYQQAAAGQVVRQPRATQGVQRTQQAMVQQTRQGVSGQPVRLTASAAQQQARTNPTALYQQMGGPQVQQSRMQQAVANQNQWVQQPNRQFPQQARPGQMAQMPNQYGGGIQSGVLGGQEQLTSQMLASAQPQASESCGGLFTTKFILFVVCRPYRNCNIEFST